MYEERGNKSNRSRYSGPFRDAQRQQYSQLNMKSCYRYNRKYDRSSSTTGYSNPQYNQRSWQSNGSYYASYHEENHASFPVGDSYDNVISAPKYVRGTYASMADYVEERDHVETNPPCPPINRDNNPPISKLSVLPSNDTVNTIIGSSEDMSEGISSASYSFEHTDTVSCENQEVVRRIFSQTVERNNDIQISTYYRDRIANINACSLFAVSPKSFLFGKRDSRM